MRNLLFYNYGIFISVFIVPLILIICQLIQINQCCSYNNTKQLELNEVNILSLKKRAKRYLSFPEGASFTVSVCFTVGILGNPRNDYMSFGLNWGSAYDLPNVTWVLNHIYSLHNKVPKENIRHDHSLTLQPQEFYQRRSRRALYKAIELSIDNIGHEGQDCVLRALCESGQYFQKPAMTMLGEMIRAVFSLPKQRLLKREIRENEDLRLYDHAYRYATSDDCSKKFKCSFSLIELAFGKYSTPPINY